MENTKNSLLVDSFTYEGNKVEIRQFFTKILYNNKFGQRQVEQKEYRVYVNSKYIDSPPYTPKANKIGYSILINQVKNTLKTMKF